MRPFIFYFMLFLPGILSLDLETFKINLDLPPEARWESVILSKRPFIQNYTKMVLQTLEYPKISLLISEIYGRAFFSNTDFAREIEGVAKFANLTFAEVFLMNYMYESFAACTSIVYEDEFGSLVLGHNLDYDFTQPMAKSIVMIEVFKRGNMLFRGQVVAGQIGVFTGMRIGKYGLTLNQRKTGDYFSHWKELLINKVYPVIYNIRLGLEQTNSYSEAIGFFSNVPLGSPCYLILVGTEHNQGLVLTRNPSDVSSFAILKSEDEDSWFLVQTNSDRDLKNYEVLDIRRYIAEQRMKAIGRGNITKERILEEVLAKFPNNNYLTILSSYLQPQTGEFNTTMWL